MELKNFNILDGYSLSIGDENLDLHNDYVFSNLYFFSYKKSLLLKWSRNEGDWVSDNIPPNIVLSFERVSVFHTRYVAIPNDLSDGRTLSFIGFMYPEYIGNLDGYLDKSESDNSCHIILGFENGLRLNCYAEIVSCELE